MHPQPGSVRRHGAAAVELAVVLPLLLGLLLGIWEVGRLVEVQQLTVNAAREGGRQASTGTKTYDEIYNAVVNYLTNTGITNTAGVTVEVTNLTTGSGPNFDPSTANQLDHLRVTVTLPFDNVRWAILGQITDTKTLTGTSEWYSMKDNPVTVSTTLPVE